MSYELWFQITRTIDIDDMITKCKLYGCSRFIKREYKTIYIVKKGGKTEEKHLINYNTMNTKSLY